MERRAPGNAEPDPGRIAAWVAGWALARNIAPPVAFEGGLRVDTATLDERLRYVLFSAEIETIRRLMIVETRTKATIKICAAEEKIAPLLPPNWRLHERQYLMTIPIRQSPARTPLAGYAARMQNHRPILHAAMTDRTGREVASGRLVLIGRYGIVDKIYTDPDHRKRGLATRVVGDLMRVGRVAGAKTGLLVANANGFPLYLKMGWEIHTPYTSIYNV